MAILLILLIIMIIIILSYYIYKESTGFHVVKYNISSKKIKNDSVTIVFLSDLHNNQYGEGNSALIETIDDIHPDYVMIGGDMITSCMEKWKDPGTVVKFVKELALKYPVYYGMGNHEERLRRVPDKFPDNAYNDLNECLRDASCPILDNEKITIGDSGIELYGLNLDHAYFRKVITRHFPEDYLSGKLGNVNEDKYNILLAHNPEHFKGYAKWGADLVLSGHVHGGIVRLPVLGGVISPAFKLFPKYDGGIFREGNAVMVLSRGLGSHTIPIRINNKAELVVINITKE